MTGFKSFLESSEYLTRLPDPSVSISSQGFTLHLRFDSRDVVASASYEGRSDVWMSSLCHLIREMDLSETQNLDFSHWEKRWKEDQVFWDLRQEISDEFSFFPLELLHAALDVYKGREFLYHDESPLICRCFGVRESDVLNFLKSSGDATMDELSRATRAGMGCRSCVPQLKQWLLIHTPGEKTRFYKERPVADWIELIDEALKKFPEANSWKMDVEEMKGNVVIVSYDSSHSQKEEEEMGKKLQGFLAGAVEEGLAFFLRRSRQR